MDYLKTNSAVIKNTMSLMDKETFIKHALEVKNLIINFEITDRNQNLYEKYKRIYLWARKLFISKF